MKIVKNVNEKQINYVGKKLNRAATVKQEITKKQFNNYQNKKNTQPMKYKPTSHSLRTQGKGIQTPAFRDEAAMNN